VECAALMAVADKVRRDLFVFERYRRPSFLDQLWSASYDKRGLLPQTCRLAHERHNLPPKINPGSNPKVGERPRSRASAGGDHRSIKRNDAASFTVSNPNDLVSPGD